MQTQYWHEAVRESDGRLPLAAEEARSAQNRARSVRDEWATFQAVLMDCAPAARAIVAPLVKYPSVVRLLRAAVEDEPDDAEAARRLSSLLGDAESPLRQRLEAFTAEQGDDPGREAEMHHLAAAAERQPVTARTVDPKTDHTWRDLPSDELATRLRKGEVIGRDEWIPGVSEGRRKLNDEAAKEHLEFGRRIRREGNEFFTTGNTDMAYIRYSQGVRLLEWVDGESEDARREMEQLMLRFLKNHALAAFKVGRINEALESSGRALAIDEHDSKARYRMAQCKVALGDIKDAKDDYLRIVRCPHATEADVVAAKCGLKEIRRIVSDWKSDCRGILTRSAEKGVFGADRGTPMDTANSPSTKADDDVGAHDSGAETENPPEAPPSLTCEETKNMLLELLDAYTSESFTAEMQRQRQLAEYEERRIVIRARKIVPAVAQPILDKFGFSGGTFEENQRAAQKSALYWRKSEPQIGELLRSIYESVVGDFV